MRLRWICLPGNLGRTQKNNNPWEGKQDFTWSLSSSFFQHLLLYTSFVSCASAFVLSSNTSKMYGDSEVFCRDARNLFKCVVTSSSRTTCSKSCRRFKMHVKALCIFTKRQACLCWLRSTARVLEEISYRTMCGFHHSNGCPPRPFLVHPQNFWTLPSICHNRMHVSYINYARTVRA